MADQTDPRFERLFSESREALGRYVRRFVKTTSLAEDIVQEAFLRTYRQWNDSLPMRPYLFTIARNLAFKSRRHDKVVDAHALDSGTLDAQHGVESPEKTALHDERMRLLNDAIANLPPQCRAVFTRRMFHGQPYKEIAAELNISPKTVEKHIALATRSVHAKLTTLYKDVDSHE